LASAGKDGAVKLWNTADFKMLANLTGHEGPVTGVAFSANGQVLASSGADRTVRFWNVPKGQLIATVGAHTGSANAVAMHPNNTLAFSAGDDGLLKFWQVPPAPSRAFPAQGATVQAAVLSPDGNQVLTGGADKTVRLSALATAAETKKYDGAVAAVQSVALNSNGTFVAAGTSEGGLVMWNGPDAKMLEQISAHTGAVTGLSVNPQNTQLLTGGGDGLLKLWALPPVPARSLTHPDGVLTAAASVDGKRLFTGSNDKILRSWDLTKNAIERQFTGHAGTVSAVAVSGNGQILASGSADTTIRIWNQATGKESAIVGAHNGTVTALAVNAAGSQLLSSGGDGAIKLWQLPMAPPRPFVHPDPVTSLAVSPDGNKLLTGSGDKLARLWNLKTGAKERDFPGHTLALTAVAFSGNGQMVAAASADKSISVWNAADAKLLKKIPVPAAANAVAFSPDGKSIVAGLADNSIRTFTIAESKDKKKESKDEGKTLTGHTGPVTNLAFTPKGDLVSASADKTVRLWTAAGEAKKLEHTGPVVSLALSKDGKLVAAAAEKSIKVWSIDDGKEAATLTAPTDIRGLAFSPDAKRLVAGGGDKIARIYEIDGRLAEFFVHDGPVSAVAFAGPKEIVTGGADKLARVWTSSLIWQTGADPTSRARFSAKGDQVLAPVGKVVKVWNATDGNEMKSLAAQEEAITFLDQSSDGSRLLTAGADKSVKIWDSKDEKKPLATIALKDVPQAVALSANGLRLAVALEEQKTPVLRVFDTASGRELQVMPEHKGAIQSLAFLGDNKTLISASLDKTARVSTVGVLAALEAHPGGVSGAQFHSNGNQAISAGADKTVKLWDLVKGVVVKTFGPLETPIKAVVFSRDYTQVAAAAGKNVMVWNLADGKPLMTLAHPADVLSISFSPDKTKIATGAADKLTRVWSTADGKELQFFTQDEGVAAVVFDTKNTGIISAGGKTPRIDTLAISRVIAASNGPLYALSLTPAGTHVLAGGADKLVNLWNINNGAAERRFVGADEAVKAVTMAKNNILVAIGGADKTVRVHNFNDAKELGAVKAGGVVQSLAFSPNSLALAAGCGDNTVLTWDTTLVNNQPAEMAFLKPIQSFAHGAAATDVVFAADNATIYSAGLDKNVQAWKLASPAPIKNFPHPNIVDAVSFNPAGTQVATGAHDGKLRIFDIVKGVVLKDINAHPTVNATMIYAVAYSPDGKQIVTAGYDNSLKLWDATSGAMVREFKAYKVKEFEKGHQDSVFAAAFSPDGKFLASGSGGLERIIKIWDVAKGTVVRDLANPQLQAANPKAPPQSHPGWIYKLRFTKDGKNLLSVGDAPMNKGYLAVWNPEDGKLLYGEALPLGNFFGLSVAADRSMLAIGAGPRGRPTPEFNCAYLLKWPVMEK